MRETQNRSSVRETQLSIFPQTTDVRMPELCLLLSEISGVHLLKASAKLNLTVRSGPAWLRLVACLGACVPKIDTVGES